MNLFIYFGTFFYIFTVSTAVPFTGWLFGGKQQTSDETSTRPAILDKAHKFGQKVYERKREFFNGVNEKVSNLLWIQPLYTTTETVASSEKSHLFYHEPSIEKDSVEFMNVEIYARSSFLSPDELDDNISPSENDKLSVTNKVQKNFNLLGRIWS